MRATITLSASKRAVERHLRTLYDGPPDDPAPAPERYFEEMIADLDTGELDLDDLRGSGPIRVSRGRIEKR